MKIFNCTKCEQVVYFESVQCVRCGHVLAYLPDRGTMSAVARDAGATDAAGWRVVGGSADGARYRPCLNATEHGVCNWAVPADDPEELCAACRLNHLIPNLADAKAKEDWHRIEIAKRRLLYTLFGLGLPVEGKRDDAAGGLAFDFLQDGAEGKVFTGHSDGLITINIAEAEDPFREKMRAQLGENYRTVLGHFRHESGHYYWDRLVDGSPQI